MPTATARPLLNLREAAAFLQLPMTTIRTPRFRRKTGIPYFMVGRHIRFREEDLIAWMAEQRRAQKALDKEIQRKHSADEHAADLERAEALR